MLVIMGIVAKMSLVVLVAVFSVLGRMLVPMPGFTFRVPVFMAVDVFVFMIVRVPMLMGMPGLAVHMFVGMGVGVVVSVSVFMLVVSFHGP